MGRYPEMSPEERLLTAMLVRAIEDLTRKSGGLGGIIQRPDRIFEEAREWFSHQGEEEWSYRWVLEVLDIEHETVREVVKKIRDDPVGMKYWTAGPRMPLAGGGKRRKPQNDPEKLGTQGR